MRIWHEKLIHGLCRQHLLAMWREGLGCWSILVNNKKGYRNHPAVKEFEMSLIDLSYRLRNVREEMIERGYKPKEIYFNAPFLHQMGDSKPWQTLKEQLSVIKSKNCKCNFDYLK